MLPRDGQSREGEEEEEEGDVGGEQREWNTEGMGCSRG